jgi:4'-phosphopantetheinyl transferase
MIESVVWSAPPAAIALHDNEVHIWRAWLDVEPREHTRLSSYLSADELLRADRFVFPRDRHHFTVARGRLRELLAIYLKCPPESFRFRTGKYGKPSLPEDIPVRFNLTHSYGLALYGFSLNRELGIDVEKIRAEFASKEIAGRYFSAAEQRELSQLPTEMHTDAFFLCWTRKEAYVKAHGDGLQVPLDSFDVSLTPGKPEILRSTDQERWSMRSFSPASQYVGSIVGEGKFPSINFWDYQNEPAIAAIGEQPTDSE